MKSDNRLWRTIHVLIHMNHQQEPITSKAIGAMLGTNPVVVRRTMAGLRNKNYVQSEKGHGGGWRLTCSLEEITLLEVYQALGEPPIFAVGPASDNPGCLVEKAVNDAIGDVLEQAKALLLERFNNITLSRIESDFKVLLADRYLA